MEILSSDSAAKFASKLNSLDLKKLKHAFHILATMDGQRLFASNRIQKVLGQDNMYIFRFGDLRLYISKTEMENALLVLDIVKANEMNPMLLKNRS